MARVKMNAKHEYEYIANFKVMQKHSKVKGLIRFAPSVALFTTVFIPTRTAHTGRKACQMQDQVRRLSIR